MFNLETILLLSIIPAVFIIAGLFIVYGESLVSILQKSIEKNDQKIAKIDQKIDQLRARK